jgi:hypothetical protein
MPSDCDCRDYDDDGNPEPCFSAHKEEPDCHACNDGGCRHCERHDPDCACEICTTPVLEPSGNNTFYSEEAPF